MKNLREDATEEEVRGYEHGVRSVTSVLMRVFQPDEVASILATATVRLAIQAGVPKDFVMEEIGRTYDEEKGT
jgi:hypothetical protein